MNSVIRATTAFCASSIGKKLIVAVTGAALLIFLAGHLAGNLLIYRGPEEINSYAYELRHVLHGALLWVARIGLVACFGLHIGFTIALVRENRGARAGGRYVREKPIQVSMAARTMILSGLVVASFVVYHLMHFTLQVTDKSYKGLHYTLEDGKEVHDVYSMVISGFGNPLISGFYILSMAILSAHLSHGFASVFQTFGFRTPRTAGLVKGLGLAYAAIIFFGNISIPISVLTGFLGPLS